MSATIKLSSPATKEFWEIPVLFEDEHLLALNKPAGLLTSPDRDDPNRPNLMRLLHDGIAAGKPWARERGLAYLSNAHRLDFEMTGVLLLARNKPMLVALANLFGTEKPEQTHVALVQGSVVTDRFEVDAALAPHPLKLGRMRVDQKSGKQAKSLFEVLEKFSRYTLLKCRPLTSRTHQIRVHLQHLRLPIVGDTVYGGRELLLSRLKSDYELKPGKIERPLISTVVLHAEKLELTHPVTNQLVSITAPWPKDLNVAVKYLRRYATM